MTRFQIRKRVRSFLKRNKYYIFGFFGALLAWYALCLPKVLFEDPVSTVVTDRNGQLLGARIADDGQWRFPQVDSIPEKVKLALLTFEDKRFYHHFGIDPKATGRALYQNFTRGEIISGGSTLTMQVIRLSRKGKSRTYTEKFIEMIQATRLEIKHSKDEILSLYLTHAPFGGNVVGIDAASWKYYGRSPHQLSWAEAATLAVLPNSPSLIHPGRNRLQLREKRDRLLKLMLEEKVIDKINYELALFEPLPQKPLPLPSAAPHLLERIRANKKGQANAIFQTTLDIHIQERSNVIINRHLKRLDNNGIHNAAAVVVDVKSGDILAYIGNGRGTKNGRQVDMIEAHRSTGSIIKPLLYACMMDDGKLLPNTLVSDVPTQFGGYTPKNYNLDYAGAVPASKALSRSLNIPAARMLSDYGHKKFLHRLHQFGATTLTRPADDYGLSLILGGAETSIGDLASIYSSMARTLVDYPNNSGYYDDNAFRPINYDLKNHYQCNHHTHLSKSGKLGAGAIWKTFEAMIEVARPGEANYWQNFNSTSKIAWKTGTSFGFRDAWAVGISPQFVVVVWSGNADGEGRPELIGAKASGPILFDIFNAIDFDNDWFPTPHDDLVEIAICKHSGHRSISACNDTTSEYVPSKGLRTLPCSYCKIAHLDQSEKWQVSEKCYAPSKMIHRSFFSLPPKEEHYYRIKHPNYKGVPPFKTGCDIEPSKKNSPLELIYPSNNATIFIPINLDQTKSSVVFEAAHRNKNTTIYWHLDNEFVGETSGNHQMSLTPNFGNHIITLVDETGESISENFSVTSGSATTN